ncbi:Methyltransferase-like protein 2 [Smittium mucronatum]|uniref:tRNA N(3)-methylcytidine methyltransferase n=1 Tax=Smittium mucronatum TaxID=133383 RepID=A0A1R0GL56_9FUNG|nr:Methyltransferase-like protein 2 [Smittium mucronatum]
MNNLPGLVEGENAEDSFKKRQSSVVPVELKEQSKKTKGQTQDQGQIHKSSEQVFGQRKLDENKDVFQFNAWDDVEPDEEYMKYANEKLELHRNSPVSQEIAEKCNSNPEKQWDVFYSNNQNRFFKDRNWFYIEFPELFSWTDKVDFGSNSEVSKDTEGEKKDKASVKEVEKSSENKKLKSLINSNDFSEKYVIMELGCGAGNTVFPLLKTITDERLRIYACDYSKVAVEIVQSLEEYKNDNRVSAFVWDITSTELPKTVEKNSVDVIICVFVLSAIHPDQIKQAISNIHSLLKKGGIVLFRDYGKYDLAQVRLKKNRLLSENFYIRGDHTRVYFFENKELDELFNGKDESGNQMFETLMNGIDKRLIVNRTRKIKMHRVWIQAKFRKL